MPADVCEHGEDVSSDDDECEDDGEDIKLSEIGDFEEEQEMAHLRFV